MPRPLEFPADPYDLDLKLIEKLSRRRVVEDLRNAPFPLLHLLQDVLERLDHLVAAQHATRGSVLGPREEFALMVGEAVVDYYGGQHLQKTSSLFWGHAPMPSLSIWMSIIRN